MAKKTKSRPSNAHGTPSSLTRLLLPRATQVPAAIKPSRIIRPEFSPLDTGDRRYYVADRTIRPPAATVRSATRLRIKPDPFGDRIRSQAYQAYQDVPRGVQFSKPREVAVCVRRKMRREVLFAKRAKIGKGARRRNLWSKISC